MPIQINYYYRKFVMDAPESAGRHDEICALLSQLRAEGQISEYVIQETEVAFPNKDAEATLLNRLREFAPRHKVGLAKPFGSRRYGFCYLPQQFLLVSESDRFKEVFPCVIGDKQVESLEYLRRIASGQPWTVRSVRGMEGRKHKVLADKIAYDPTILEPGLMLRGKSIQVSQDFGELGIIDLVFEDRPGQILLIEVKAGPTELYKAIGQILCYRELYAQQNQIQRSVIRAGIACPVIPPYCRSTCEQVGIACFEVPIPSGSK